VQRVDRDFLSRHAAPVPQFAGGERRSCDAGLRRKADREGRRQHRVGARESRKSQCLGGQPRQLPEIGQDFFTRCHASTLQGQEEMNRK